MAYHNCTFLLFAVIFVAYGTCNLSEEAKKAMKEKFTPIINKCAKEHNVDPDKELLKELSKQENACFFACNLRSIGVLDDKGMFVKEPALEAVHLFVDTEEEMAKIEELLDFCASVNKEPVSDGDKGCDRSVLLIECFESQAEKMGLKPTKH